jgi:glycosyltransferase involved in cell wall biosynthesis
MTFSKKVDVLVVTFNNSRTLSTCLNHVRDFIPYDKILVGDGGSRDATVDVAKRMGAEVYSYKGKDNMIGRIRYKLAERAETEWVLYIDSDTYVYPNFWEIISRYMRTGVGMVMATQDTPYGTLRKYPEWAYKRVGFATFSDTLAPRRLILECKELIDTHTCEDSLYESFLADKNYKIVRIYNHLSYHDKPLHTVYGSARRDGRDTGQKGSLFALLWTEAFYLRNLLWFSLEKRPKEAEILEHFRCSWEFFKGFLEGLKGLVGKRETPILR